MLDVQGRMVTHTGQGVSRRDFVRVGALGAMGLTLTDWFRMKAHGSTQEPKAKSVIQLWMGGGPTHIDTWDPKPEAGEDYTGPLKHPIETNVPGMRISESLPLMAKQADKYAIIRSMTHGSYGHEIGTYIMQTGTMPSELVYPSMGAVLAHKRDEAGYQGNLPPYITLTYPLGRFSEAGFLGTNYKTFVTGGDPNAASLSVQGLTPPGGVTPDRLKDRATLLKSVDSLAREMEGNKSFEAMDSYQEKAYGLLLGDAKNAFNMSEETDALREKYGRNHFGQSCLLARRLVERGVPFITIHSGGWDTHRDNFAAMKNLLPPLDQGFAALLEDLAEKGLLDSTIITWFGEFGRTPKIAPEAPWDGGRHHWGPVMSTVVAGGGFKGGVVLGSTDAKGEQPKDRPIYPWDLTASMYTLLGIDPKSTLPHPQGCVAHVTPVGSGNLQSGGLLKEIM